MHNKYGKDGFVAVSVSIDPIRGKDGKVNDKAVKDVTDFLQKQKATFPNFILDAKEEEWQKKLGVWGPPCVYVFNRDNHFVLKRPVVDKDGVPIKGKEVDYDLIEKTVADLMKK
jgi:hypothetical protein